MKHAHPLPNDLARRGVWSLLAPVLLGIQACANSAAPAPQAPAALWGTQWELSAIGAQAVPSTSKATLQFSEAGRAVGNGSCNRFSGAVSVDQDRVVFGAIISTKMACGGEAMAVESAYLSALKNAQRFERQGETLLIHLQGSALPLRFALAK